MRASELQGPCALIGGKSRYPGLFIWLRDGSKYRVTVPEGCLLLQAGKQFEWLTGGAVTAGFHEVVVTEDTLKVLEKVRFVSFLVVNFGFWRSSSTQRRAEKLPQWRISSTVFGHIASDQLLQPLGHFAAGCLIAV